MNIKGQVTEKILSHTNTTLWADEIAEEIHSLYEQAGYRKIPELKVLSNNEIQSVIDKIWENDPDYGIPQGEPIDRAIAQAQLDSIEKQIAEANDED